MATAKLITIDRLGGLRGLQFKRGEGFDLRQMGTAHIVRISEVAWNDACQAWQVDLLQGELFDYAISEDLIYELLAEVESQEYADQLSRQFERLESGSDEHGIILFAEYEDAVKAEVLFIQTARKLGKWKLA